MALVIHKRANTHWCVRWIGLRLGKAWKLRCLFMFYVLVLRLYFYELFLKALEKVCFSAHLHTNAHATALSIVNE